ncbi:hypothetical protein TNCV_14591 [Trichonephila clavipes]|nr:hypothetical protein TNCV_14591 [Trichonephila clavipes]
MWNTASNGRANTFTRFEPNRPEITKVVSESKSLATAAIDHVWDVIGRHLFVLCNPPRNLNDLATDIRKWVQIPQSGIDELFAGMNSFYRVSIFARGGRKLYR